ncbi:hypothetical protein [Kaarinaea lacus]
MIKPAYRHAGMSRRSFLSYLAVPATLSFVTPGCMIANSKYYQTDKANKLAFVDRDGLGPNVDAPTVQHYFAPLHAEQPVTARLYNQQEIEDIKSVLKTEFEHAGYSWDDSYDVSFSYQHFGVPDDDVEKAEQLLAYCQRVQDYLYTRLDGLFNVNMDWTMLPRDPILLEEIQQGFHGNVGRYTYYVLRAFVDHPELDGLPSLINAQPLDRAIHYIVGDELSLPKRANLYIIPGKTSLVSPFSELLHLTFHAPSQNYAAELCKNLPEEQAQRYALDAGETINEATAIIMASQYIKDYGASERLPIINDMANSLNHRFNHLNGAMAYINRNGLQKSVDTYLENPGRFMQQIVNV